MGCKTCGSVDLVANLGTCGFCIFIAFAASVVSWAGFFLVRDAWHLQWVAWIVMGYAVVLTLLLMAHLLALLERKWRKTAEPQ